MSDDNVILCCHKLDEEIEIGDEMQSEMKIVREFKIDNWNTNTPQVFINKPFTSLFIMSHTILLHACSIEPRPLNDG
jgi:hypothetical protein